MTIVIKIGSTVLSNPDKTLNEEVLTHFAEQVAQLYEEDHQILIVTSGGVAAGKGIVNVSEEKRRYVRRQMYAGMGQAILMRKYTKVFEKHNIPIAQCLITRANFADKGEYDNLMNTVEGYLKFRIIPLLNENDIIANNENNFGGNDYLAALTAASIKADKLIILSDVDCLYDKDPHLNKDAKPLHVVDKIDEEIEMMCGGSSSSMGLGGMISKIESIKIAIESGIDTYLGRGTDENILHDLVDTKKKVGTYFRAQKGKAGRFKHWLKHCSLPSGTIIIDSGAAKAVKKRKSLLFVGIKEVSDGFKKDDTVYIVDEHNQPVATGKIDFSSKEIKSALKEKKNLEVVIHSDNLSVH